MSSPTASLIAGITEMVEGAPSSWRPPWLETTMPSTPARTASRASSGSRMPLITIGPAQCWRTQAMSSQVIEASKFRPIQPQKSPSPLASGTAAAMLPKVCGVPLICTSHSQSGWVMPSQTRFRPAKAWGGPERPLRMSR